MKTLKVIKTIVIYDKDGQIVKEIDVTGWSWARQIAKAVHCTQMTLTAATWSIIITPE